MWVLRLSCQRNIRSSFSNLHIAILADGYFRILKFQDIKISHTVFTRNIIIDRLRVYIMLWRMQLSILQGARC